MVSMKRPSEFRDPPQIKIDRQDRQDRQGADRFEPSLHADETAYAVIGAAIEVHSYLGPGFLESIYESALAIEFRLRNIPFDRQSAVEVHYKDFVVGDGRADFIVGGSVIVELKAVEGINDAHRAQLISYLKATNINLGLILNFKARRLRDGIQRVVWNPILPPLGGLGDLGG